jgi:hypothetical protein
MNLEKKQISNIVSFFRIVCNLKKIKREGWIHKSKIDLPESVADHSYSMCTISMVLADILNLQTEHIMKMANLHDLAESLVGDKMPDSISREKKALVEGKAMKIILSKLPVLSVKNISIFGMNTWIIQLIVPSLFIIWTRSKWPFKQKNMNSMDIPNNHYKCS